MSIRIPKIKNFFHGNERTVLLKKNIVGSFLLKGVSILISLLIVPLTIDYVNPTRYGIWLTLSSLMGWFYFFDMGFALGLQNRFAEAKARGETLLARQYVSTTYAALAVMALVMYLIAIPVNSLIDWSSLLKVSESYREELSRVFLIMIVFIGMNLVVQILNKIVSADQRPVIASLIHVIGQIAVLFAIAGLSMASFDGGLVSLAFAFCGIPPVVLMIASVFLFRNRYSDYVPSVRMARLGLVKDILGMGGKFFVITTSMLFIFQLMNVIISRELGPEAVTEYNIAFKYFNVAYMVATIILTPFWSAFTDAYTKRNFEWMRIKLRQLERLWLIMLPILLLMLVLAPPVFSLWVGDSVSVPFETNLSVAIYVALLSLANVYMFLINGIGTVSIQLYIYLGFALVAYPAMTMLCRCLGIPGLLLIPSVVYVFQATLGAIQIRKVINQKATGIWSK